ncbi:ABC transporter permease [bacterium]|nr:ABC transporter permease [bacterium]
MPVKKPHPPRSAQWLLTKVSVFNEQFKLLTDFELEYDALSAQKGLLHASAWYWMQTLYVLCTYLTFCLNWSVAMIKNYLSASLRHMKKDKIYTIITIAGFAFGITFFMLISLYVNYELTYENHHAKADRVYRMVRDRYAHTPAPLGPALQDNFPEIEAYAQLLQSRKNLVSYKNSHFIEDTFHWAGPDIFTIFTIPFVKGDPETALRDPHSIVLSETAAYKYFGYENPLGKTLMIDDRVSFTVKGVFSDMPANSHFVMDFIAPYMDWIALYNNNVFGWSGNFSYTYVLLREGTNPDLLEEKIHSVVTAPLCEQAGYPLPAEHYFLLQNIKDIHLHSHRQQEISANNTVESITLFSVIAFIILVIACINYVNLATARSMRRSKEVGLRKLVGANKKQVIYQFLTESAIVALLALCIAVIGTIVLLPKFNHMIGRSLSFSPFTDSRLFFGLAGIVILSGLIAGSYPALCISGFTPITVLRGSFMYSDTGKKLQNFLVMFQFAITIVLFIATFTIKDQLIFMKSTDPGYEKDHIVIMDVGDEAARKNIEAIKTDLKQHPHIQMVSTSFRLPNDIDTFIGRPLNEKKPEESITIYYNFVDYDYIDLFGIELSEGRNFSREFSSDAEGVYLVNEAAVKAAGWEEPVGYLFEPNHVRPGRIVGVMKDFHLHSLHSPIDPVYLMLRPGNFTKLAIKIDAAGIPESLAYIKSVMKKYAPHYPFEYSFFDEVFDQAYHAEERTMDVFTSFAVLAIGIACLGLIGLSSYTAGQRKKEIAVRKVLGASVSGIVTRLSANYVKWVVVSNLLAWPAAYMLMNKWLSNFAFRTEIHFWLFPLSGLFAMAVALMTVSYQTIKAAYANPVQSLKHE